MQGEESWFVLRGAAPEKGGYTGKDMKSKGNVALHRGRAPPTSPGPNRWSSTRLRKVFRCGLTGP